MFDSTFGVMDGVTNYYYQPEVQETDIRIVDNTLNTASVAAQRHEEAPNYRAQFDNVVWYRDPWRGRGARRQGRPAVLADGHGAAVRVNQDMYTEFDNGARDAGAAVQHADVAPQLIRMYGLFAQDAWSLAGRR